MAPSAAAVSTMHNACILHTSDSRLTSTLSSVARIITSLIFREAQLSASLSHLAGFFADLVTGALGASALYEYINHNQCDRAKVKLAVYHILHVIQRHPDYSAMLQDPQELLKHIESEVMRLVDQHLTKDEAGQAIKELKRNYAHIATKEQVHKRVRGNQRDVARERMGLHLAPADNPSPRGFLPSPVIEQPYVDHGLAPKPEPIFNLKSRLSSSTPDAPRCDPPVQQDAPFKRGLFTSVQKQIRSELEQDDKWMDTNEVSCSIIPHVPKHLFAASPCPSGRRAVAPSPEPSVFVGHVTTSTPVLPKQDDGCESEVDYTTLSQPSNSATSVAESPQEPAKAKGKRRVKTVKSPYRNVPEPGSFGLNYDDSDIYSSSPSSDDEDVQARCPSTVVRKLNGVKCSGTALSPILGSPSTTDVLQATGSPAQIASQAPVEPVNVLPFAHWYTEPTMKYSSSEPEDEEKPVPLVNMSTQPEVTYSSSEHGSEDEAPALPAANTATPSSPLTSPGPAVVANPVQENDICETVEQAEGHQCDKPGIEQENLPPSPPSRKRKSPSSSPEGTPDTSPLPKHPRSSRSSPLADIINGLGSPRRSPNTPSPRASGSPPVTPFKIGRGRGRTGTGTGPVQPAVLQTPKVNKAKKAAKTPGTRKSSR